MLQGIWSIDSICCVDGGTATSAIKLIDRTNFYCVDRLKKNHQRRAATDRSRDAKCQMLVYTSGSREYGSPSLSSLRVFEIVASGLVNEI